MLIFTNRDLKMTASNASALRDSFDTFSDVLNSVNVSADAENTGWRVAGHQSKLTDATALKLLSAVLSGSKPVLIYLHGNNNTPAACFTRCQQLEDQYGVAVIGYSWASEGYLPNGEDQAGLDTSEAQTDLDEDSLSVVMSKKHLKVGWIERKARRYGQAKLNAQYSKDSLARLLRLLAMARLKTMKREMSFAAHSLGCHFLYYSVNEQDAEASLSAMHNVILLAGCTDASKHMAWVGQIHPLRRVYITYTKADSVLAASTVIDGLTKLGTSPGVERLTGAKYRYIDFQGSAGMPFGAHRYFVETPGKKLSPHARKLFQRIFTSQFDFDSPAEQARVVYPVACTADGSVCYMGSLGGGEG